MHDPLRQPPEILDQHDPQCDRHRPEFADRQRLDLLVGPHVANQHFGIEAAVGVGDEGPGHAEHARISRERSLGELGQLPVIARRQVGANVADLPLDEMIVVDQPFGRRGDRAPLVDRLGDGAIGIEQHRSVVGEPTRQRMALGRLRCDGLRDREAPRVLLQALDAEEFFANRFSIVPG